MTTYGRNFGFRIPPDNEYRFGRFTTPGIGSPIPLGAPVVADTVAGLDPLGLQIVKLVTGATPPTGLSGVVVYEYAPAAFAGFDPMLTTYSDLGTAPLGKAVQVISGSFCKLWLANTVAEVFLGTRNYPGRTMVNGLGATPTVAVGNYLIPGNGDDVNGYWVSSASATNAWMIITNVDTVRAEVEARMLF
jgi:hypothetical protein